MPMTLDSAERAIRQGSNLGFFAAGLTLALIVIAMAVDAASVFATWNDPWLLLDVFLAAGLAFGIRRRSRVAAVSMLIYFIMSKFYMMATVGSPPGLVISLFFLYFFGRALRGTFVYHRIRRQQDPTHKTISRWHYFVWPPVALLYIVLVVYGLFLESGTIPTTAVLEAHDVNNNNIELLRSNGILLPDEEIILFYSAGLLSILEDGNVLTDRRAISYETVDDSLMIAYADYSQIADVTLESRGSFIKDTRILVTTIDGDQFLLLASTEADGDKEFLAELERRRKAEEDRQRPVNR